MHNEVGSLMIESREWIVKEENFGLAVYGARKRNAGFLTS